MQSEDEVVSVRKRGRDVDFIASSPQNAPRDRPWNSFAMELFTVGPSCKGSEARYPDPSRTGSPA